MMVRRAKGMQQTRTNSTTAVNLSKRVQDGLLIKVNSILSQYDWSTSRDRLIKIDKAIQLESDSNRTTRDKYGYEADTQAPVLKPEIDTAHAFFVDLFCSGDPMFKVVQTKDNEEAAKMMQAQVTSDALHYGYSTQFSLFLRDCLKYNEGAVVELTWAREEVFQPMNDITFDRQGNAEAGTTLYEGNKVRRIDPYNAFFDRSVPANEVSRRGQYAGYVERMALTELHEMLAGARAAGKQVMNETADMWRSQPNDKNFHVPQVRKDSSNNSGEGEWGSFFFPDEAKNVLGNRNHTVNYSEHYEVTTVYMRIIPAMFNMPVTSAKRVQIWKFVIVNGQYIVLAERQTNAHNLLPIFVCQMDDEGIWSDAKSMAEYLMPYQNTATQMQDALLGMVWKTVSDKGIYDSRRISKRDIESKDPKAKIPARPSANNSDLRGAYLPLGTDTSALGIIQQGLAQMKSHTGELTGQNSASRGQFQKGNKTMAEFNEIMGNSESRKYVQALLLENVIFQPVKNVMKLNILQYAQSGKRQAGGEEVEVNPATMRTAVLDFRIADGLKNVERVAKTPQMLQAFQLLAPYAQLAPAYNVDPFKMIMDYLRNLGLDMDNYTPEQMNETLLPRGGSANAPTETPEQ